MSSAVCENMTTEQEDVGALADQARAALLKQIAVLAPKMNSGHSIAQLAEAYAWCKYPNQPHGGGAAVSK
ncbi:hypothetical protein SAMN05660733_07681 [Lentzea albidocapillata]|uniref:Uncharacterized protein n=2 Tax=Lentzea albidocapillata TaxID=40571 RepID=A0A1W2FQT2_9PSEU|nr:hypothetical protein SAMN05660733_07681 [Lentzea albidocapillata]